MTDFSSDQVKAVLTDDHKIRRLEGHHALIHQTHAGVRECRDRLEQREPPDANELWLFFEDVIVPSARRDIWGHDDETGELDKDEILPRQLHRQKSSQLTITTIHRSARSARYSTPPSSST
jgi:hypothetical protein